VEISYTMDQVTIRTPNPKCWLFLKITCKGTWRQVFICPRPPGVVKQFCRFRIWSTTQCITTVYALHTTRSPPPSRYTLYKYIPLFLFKQGWGGGGRTSEKVRGALVHKKYEHDWISCLSTLLKTSKNDI
jgi:hypothetical protein